MAAAYFGIVFPCAFATGAIRVLLVEPKIGDTAALFIEVPILVVASWIVAIRLMRDRIFSLAKCAAIGMIAFLLTMASEATLSFVMRAQSLGEWAATVATPLGMIGLAGQLAFAAMPFLVVRYGSAAETANAPRP